MKKSTLNKEIYQLTAVSYLNTLSNELTSKRIQLAKMQHKYYNKDVDVCLTKSDTDGLKKDIERLEKRLFEEHLEIMEKLANE